MSDTLTLDDLKLIAGTTFGLTDRQWRKVQFAFLEVSGKHVASAHHITQACLNETYDEIASDLVVFESDDSITENILQIILFLCRLNYGSAADLDSCKNKMRDRLRHWSGKLGRMKIRAEEEAERFAEEQASYVHPVESASESVQEIETAPRLRRIPVVFLKRAAWLNERLAERRWNEHTLEKFHGPEHRTTQKILEGKAVQAGVLRKIVRALNAHDHFRNVKFSEIPND